MQEKSLCIFTAQYPYGKGETFLETEIQYLSMSFSDIYIFPMKSNGKSRNTPANVKVVNIFDNIIYKNINTLINNFNIFIPLFIAEIFKQFRNLNYIKSNLLQLLKKASILSNYLQNNTYSKDTIFYSYWFDEWATILSLLKKKGIITEYISRAHGFDLYKYRTKINHIQFRKFQLKYINKLFLISQDGYNYINKEYNKYKQKYKLSYLGTSNHGAGKFKTKDKFTILSCSNMTNIKRIDLIIKILELVQIEIRWVHLGDGNLHESLKKEAEKLPKNIEVQFCGNISNANVMQFYATNTINFFINVSASEGLPVSIMEAISFGIPIIATNVGGTSEIVNSQTGILIPKEFDIKKIAKIINNLKNSKYNNIKFRTCVREFWKEKFDAEKNYSEFITQLKS